MSKIAIDARSLSSSTGRYMRELLDGLQKLDTDNEYHVIVNPSDESAWAPTNPKWQRHTVSYQPYSLGEQFGFAWFLYQLKADLVHFTMPQQPILYLKKRVTTVHDLTLVHFKNVDMNAAAYAAKQTIFKIMLWLTVHHSKHIIAPSQYTKEDLANYAGLKVSKITVTYEAAADFKAKGSDEEVPELKGQDFILYVGNAFPYKNLVRLTEAMQVIKETNPSYKLALAGKPEFFYEQLDKHVRERDLKNIQLLGYVSDGQLSWLYKHAKAYVFPSLSEGFGLPGLEAMQYGVPIVSSKATCLPEIYGEAAHYFDPESTPAMAQAIRDVLDDQDLRKRLIANGKTQLAKYSWDKLAKQTLEIYQKVLS